MLFSPSLSSPFRGSLLFSIPDKKDPKHMRELEYSGTILNEYPFPLLAAVKDEW